MKLIVDRAGRRRVWYAEQEIEEICNRTLVANALWPPGGDCAVNVEALVEFALGADLDYGAELPPSILGYVVFGVRPSVFISRTLSDAASDPRAPMGTVGRWRATLAHEAAHIVLHSELFASRLERPGNPPGRPVQCGQAAIETRSQSDWREVQANMGMASFLMPRTLLDREAGEFLERRGQFVPPLVDPRLLYELTKWISQRFEVSAQAARIRLETCGYATA